MESYFASLYASAVKRAATALGDFSKAQYDDGLTDMAIAVEHLSKAYLCTINPVLLLANNYNHRHLLTLAGNPAKSGVEMDKVFTIDAAPMLKRCEFYCADAVADKVEELRQVRNGIMHLGVGDDDKASELLCSGIVHIDILLNEIEAHADPVYAHVSKETFWGRHGSLC